MSLKNIITVLKGGPGSGNFGHSGRPGERGGSGDAGSGEWKDAPKLNTMARQVKVQREIKQNLKIDGHQPLSVYANERSSILTDEKGNSISGTGGEIFFDIESSKVGDQAFKDAAVKRIREMGFKVAYTQVTGDAGKVFRVLLGDKKVNGKVQKGITRIKDVLKGGPGSGNFGHSGRPGERGGSSSSGGGGGGEKRRDYKAERKELVSQAEKIERQLKPIHSKLDKIEEKRQKIDRELNEYAEARAYAGSYPGLERKMRSLKQEDKKLKQMAQKIKQKAKPLERKVLDLDARISTLEVMI